MHYMLPYDTFAHQAAERGHRKSLCESKLPREWSYIIGQTIFIGLS